MDANKVVGAASLVVFLAACTIVYNCRVTTELQRRLKRAESREGCSSVIRSGRIRGQAPNPTQLATFKQQMHTYNLYEERPIADALYEGLRAAVTASNQMWADSTAGDVKVNLTFINLQAARNSGMVSVGATSSIQIKADFLNVKTGNVIYSNISRA